MNEPTKKRSASRAFIRGGIAGLFSAFAGIGAHKFLPALGQLPDALANIIAFGLALLCIVILVAYPQLRSWRVSDQRR